jgi:hypothetical protein
MIHNLSPYKKDRITIGYCKDCKHKDIIDGKNTCTCKEITEDSEWPSDDEINNSDIIYSFFEFGCFYVGDNFGCVHFKKK